MMRAKTRETRRPRRNAARPHEAKDYAPLSVHWAFVVHLRTNTTIGHGRIAGRVEHVVSGQAAHFDSLEELLAFMARVLRQHKERR
jgi:hypothetical protein